MEQSKAQSGKKTVVILVVVAVICFIIIALVMRYGINQPGAADTARLNAMRSQANKQLGDGNTLLFDPIDINADSTIDLVAVLKMDKKCPAKYTPVWKLQALTFYRRKARPLLTIDRANIADGNGKPIIPQIPAENGYLVAWSMNADKTMDFSIVIADEKGNPASDEITIVWNKQKKCYSMPEGM